jgi:hypothetical protein
VPGGVHAAGIGEVPLVHLLHDPLVRPETGQGVVLRSLRCRHGRCASSSRSFPPSRWISQESATRLRAHPRHAAAGVRRAGVVDARPTCLHQVLGTRSYEMSRRRVINVPTAPKRIP